VASEYIQTILTSSKVLAKYGLKKNIRTVRLEDIHLHSVKTMKRLAKWLGIQFEPSLLESTFGGKAWWGDVTISPVNGFSNHLITDRWKKDYHRPDIFWLEFLLQNRFKKYSYPLSRKYDKICIVSLPLLSILVSTKIELNAARNHFRLNSHKHALKFIRLALICSHFGLNNSSSNPENIYRNFFRFLGGIRRRRSLCYSLYHDRVSAKDDTFKRL